MATKINKLPKQSLTLITSDDGQFFLTGDITHATVLSVLDVKIFDTEPKVTIDFSGVSRSDSSGLALMTHWSRLAEKANGSVCYEQVPEKLVALAKMSGLDAVLSITAAR